MVAIGQKTPVLGLDLPKRNFDLSYHTVESGNWLDFLDEYLKFNLVT